MKAQLLFGTQLLLVLAFGTSGGAWAQDSLLEEVTVTAQKREQSIQDVGIAVTAFTGDQIDKLGYTSSTDIVAMTPGVQIYGTTGDSAFSFAVRGVVQTDFNDHQESPNAVYVDEVYKSQTSTVGFSIFDIERVEVLRGPQGTIFGRNATGGLVHFITRKPSQEFDAYLKARAGSFSSYRMEGAVGGALTDSISARFSAVYDENDTFLENRVGPDGGDSEKWTVRGQVRFDLSDTADLLISASHGEMEVGTPQFYQAEGVRLDPVTFLAVSNNGPDYLGYQDTDGDPWAGDWDAIGGWGTEATNFTATLNWGIGELNLTSITDFSNVEKSFTGDTDGGAAALRPLDGTVFLPDGSFVPGRAQFANDADVDQFSQEIRLNGDWDTGRWIVGAYYLKIEGDYDSRVGFSFAGPDAGILIGPNAIFSTETTSKAVFAQAEFDLSDAFTLITGLRYTKDDVGIVYDNNIIITVPPEFTVSGPRIPIAPNGGYTDSIDDDLVTAKLELDWTPNEDWLVYGSWNLGAKGGGFNAAVTGVPVPTYKPEELSAFEGGFKYSSPAGWGRINGAVFYYDYKDAQTFQLIGGVDQIVFNADSTIKGAELEAAFNPAERWDILLSVSYVDALLEDVAAGALIVDRRPPGIPEWSGSALARYSFPALGGTIALQGELSTQSDSFLAVDNAPAMRNPAYTVGNVRASYTSGNENWILTAAIDNVADEEYKAQGFDLAGLTGSANFLYGPPRWYSLTVQYFWD